MIARRQRQGPALLQRLDALALQQREDQGSELDISVDGHLRSYLVHRFPVEVARDGRATAVGAILLDVTAARETEDPLRQAQKIEAVGQLAGGIAHDFNNLLTGILGYADMGLAPDCTQEDAREYFRIIRTTGERASELTHQILAFSRKQIMDRRPVDLSLVVVGMQRLLVRVIHEGIEVETRLSRNVVAQADCSQVEVVLLNLVTNAADAAGSRGMVTLETSVEPLPGHQEPFAVLRVRDTGSGIPDDVFPKVFEPFFTTKEVGKGTGLGLSTVYGIVKQHAGEILVDTSPQGTVFSVFFPLAAGSPPAIVEDAPLAEVPQQHGRVLLVEDEALVRRLLHRLLEGAGYQVYVAEDGRSAVNWVVEKGDNLDVVLMDVMMPKLNGREAWEEIRKIKPGLKVIFMSGYTADRIHPGGDMDRDIAFLAKPVQRDVMLAKLAEVLAETPPRGGTGR